MLNVVLLRLGDEGLVGEPRAVVGSDGTRIAPEARRMNRSSPDDVLPLMPYVSGNLHALVVEVIGRGHDLVALPMDPAAAVQVPVPHFVTSLCDVHKGAPPWWVAFRILCVQTA